MKTSRFTRLMVLRKSILMSFLAYLGVPVMGLEKSPSSSTAPQTTAANRAVPGENFTNSIGMDMIWVAEGGFWIGRTEVTSIQFATLAGGSRGSDSPKEG